MQFAAGVVRFAGMLCSYQNVVQFIGDVAVCCWRCAVC